MSQSKLLAIDAFAKTVEDARVRTTSGGLVTLGCILSILLLVLNEWNEFNTVMLRPEIVVDRDRAKRLDVNLDITFPKMPCDLLTLDVMDVSGEMQVDITSAGFEKIRLDASGKEIAQETFEPFRDSQTRLQARDGVCGSCYGARDQSGPFEGKVCCNTCDDVRQAYVEAGWAFFDGKDIEQCEKEGYVQRINDRIREGCRIRGKADINRVAGNIHIAPGASHTNMMRHVHDMSLYESHEHFSFEHTINHLSFGPDLAIEAPKSGSSGNLQNLMFSTHPLDGTVSKKTGKHHVFSYFVKVVSTRYEFLNHTFIETNQFSATKHDRPLQGGRDEDHKHTVHSRGGHPAVFFNLDISPIKVINREEYQITWGSFLLGVCSAVGGVLTVGSVLDRTVYEANKLIKQKKDT